MFKYIDARSNCTVDFVDDVELDGFLEPLALAQVYDCNSSLSHAEGNNEHWERFVRHAEERGRSKDANDDEGVTSGSVGWGQIWEIGCKVSLKFYAFSRMIFNRCRWGAKNRSPSKPCPWPSIPTPPKTWLGPSSPALDYQAGCLQKRLQLFMLENLQRR